MENTQLVKYLNDPGLLNEETLEFTRSLTLNYPWFQAGWMLYLKNLKKIQASEFDVVLKKVAVMVPDRKRLFKFLNDEISFNKPVEISTAENSMYQLEDDKIYTGGDSLIDRFLRTDLKGFKHLSNQNNGAAQLSDNEFAEKSVSENDEFVTETLANIYYQQKNYDKALSAYQKLSLKYPEKSIYFASRIKEIETIKHNT